MFAGPENAGAGAPEEPDCETGELPPDELPDPDGPEAPVLVGVLNLSGSVKNCLTAPAA